MKTFARLIRRYVLATAGIILVVVALLLGMTIYAGVRYNGASDSVQKVGALAEALHPTADGLQWDAAHTPAEWMHGYAWAMVLDEDGNVIWQQDLPEASTANGNTTSPPRRHAWRQWSAGCCR